MEPTTEEGSSHCLPCSSLQAEGKREEVQWRDTCTVRSHHDLATSIECLRTTGSRVRTLCVNFIFPDFSVSDTELLSLLEHVPNLTKLLISYQHKLTDETLRNIAQHVVNLRWLDIRACSGVTDAGIDALVQKCTNLEHVNMLLCHQETITNTALESLASLPKLVYLDVSWCYQLSLTPRGIHYFVGHGTLHTLRLQGCRQWAKDAAEYVLQQLCSLTPTLRTLDIRKTRYNIPSTLDTQVYKC